MNSISSTAMRDISISAWQTLERAAIKRRSAATVLKLLAKVMRPVAAVATGPQDSRPLGLPVVSVPPAIDAATPHVTDVPFERWAALADAYAEQFLRMQRGDKGARERALGLSNEIMRMNEAMK